MPPRPSSVQSDGSLHQAMSQSPMAQDRGIWQCFPVSLSTKCLQWLRHQDYLICQSLNSSLLRWHRVYAEKSSDAPVRLPPVSLCSVAAAVLRGTNASGYGPVSAEQLNGWLWTTGRTLWPPRCVHLNGRYYCLTSRRNVVVFLISVFLFTGMWKEMTIKEVSCLVYEGFWFNWHLLIKFSYNIPPNQWNMAPCFIWIPWYLLSLPLTPLQLLIAVKQRVSWRSRAACQ